MRREVVDLLGIGANIEKPLADHGIDQDPIAIADCPVVLVDRLAPVERFMRSIDSLASQVGQQVHAVEVFDSAIVKCKTLSGGIKPGQIHQIE